MRRQLIRDAAKALGPFEFVERPDVLDFPHCPKWLTRALNSGRYWIQEKEEHSGWMRAMIGRHDKKPCGAWSELQRIKNEAYGADRWAVQCFPPDEELTDVANIYWLYVAPAGWKPEWKL